MDYNRFNSEFFSEAYSSMYENRRAARKPESEGDKKYEKVRGEKTPMPPRGDKRREEFEKWYAKNVREEVSLDEAWEYFEEEAKKDACYNKVKARYDVWPSAYASGALVKCRQKGAKNWGNSSKKEDVDYTAAYMEGYKKLPKHKMQDKAAMKPDTAKGESQARKMDTVRKATELFPKDVKDAVKGREMDNKKRGLERRFAAPSADGAATKKAKNKAYELEGQRRRDLDKRYGPKKEELEAVFALLIGEGFATTEQGAINLIANMSDEWYDSLVQDILAD